MFIDVLVLLCSVNVLWVEIEIIVVKWSKRFKKFLSSIALVALNERIFD